MSGSLRASGPSPFEEKFGFVRALRLGERILVSGTAPISPDGSVDTDAGAQARRCFEIARQAVEELGGRLDQTVRTRMYIVDREDAAAVGSVHAEVFSGHPPTATMVVVAGLLDERWRVEIELEAVASP